jgi:hypothetical protein
MAGPIGPIGGARISALPRRSARFEPNRVCSHPDCITKLSIYNRRDTCFAHMGFKVPRLRGRTSQLP